MGGVRRPRVLRIITRLNVGGPSFQAILLSRALSERGFEARLVAGEPDPAEGNLAGEARRQGVDLHGVPSLRRAVSPRADLAALAGLLRIIRQFRPDVVHTHLAKAGVLGRLAATIARVPVVVHTFHGHVFRGYFSAVASRLHVRTERALARVTDRIVAVGPTIAEELTGRYEIALPEKVTTIRLGVPLGPRPHRAEDADHSDRPSTIGFVGRLVPVKDPGLFLRTAQQIRTQDPATRFRIAGDGPLRDRLTRAARVAGLDGALELHGWLDDMPRFYAEIDLLLLTSVNEGTPRTILEAQAAGVPVVAVDVGGVSDLFMPDRLDGDLTVCREGIIVTRRDPGPLAEACRRLLADRGARRRMGEAGRLRVERAHTEERLVDQIEALYRALLEEKGKGRLAWET